MTNIQESEKKKMLAIQSKVEVKNDFVIRFGQLHGYSRAKTKTHGCDVVHAYLSIEAMSGERHIVVLHRSKCISSINLLHTFYQKYN